MKAKTTRKTTAKTTAKDGPASDVVIGLRLPITTMAEIDAIAQAGFLGGTVDAAIVHMLQWYVFQTLYPGHAAAKRKRSK